MYSEYEPMSMTFISKQQPTFMQTKTAFTQPAILEETNSEQEQADQAIYMLSD